MVMMQSVPNILCTFYSYYVCYVCYSYHPETADLYFLSEERFWGYARRFLKCRANFVILFKNRVSYSTLNFHDYCNTLHKQDTEFVYIPPRNCSTLF